MNPARLLVCVLGLSLLHLSCDKPTEAKELAFTSSAPAFSVAYPSEWKSEKPRTSDEVFRVTDSAAVPTLAVSVYGQTEAGIINDKYPDRFIGALKVLFPRAADYKLVSGKLIALADGTSAAETCCEWTWEDGATRLTSWNVSAVKDRNLVSVTCTGMQNTPGDLLAKYPRTLKFTK